MILSFLLVITKRKDSIKDTNENEELILYCFLGKYGFVDKDNKLIIPFKYLNAREFNEGYAFVSDEYDQIKNQYKWYIINKKGKKICDVEFDDIRHVEQGGNTSFYIVKKGPKYGVYDIKKRTCIVPVENAEIIPIPGREGSFLIAKNKYSNGIYIYSPRDELWLPLKDISPEQYSVGGYFSTSEYNEKAIYTKGKDCLLIAYVSNAYNAAMNRKAICCNGKWGFVDGNNMVVIPFIYDDAGVFNNGLCLVNKEGLYGYIDTIGKEVINIKYRRAERSFCETAIVQNTEGKCGLIDTKNNKGNVILGFEYDGIQRLSFNHFAKIKRGNKWGLIDEKGKTILPIQFKDIEITNSFGYTEAKAGNKRYYIDKFGNITKVEPL